MDAANYRNVQEAIDAAESKGGGTVSLPAGKYVAKQLVLRAGVSLAGEGMNLPPHGSGTILEQEAGANTDFIVSDSHQGPTEYMHWSVISNLAILGNQENTVGSGIRFNSRTGEGLKLEHLLVRGFANAGILVSRGAVPFYGEDLHLFRNGTYGIDIARTSFDINQLVKLSLISGDDNGTALIHIGSSGGMNSGEAYIIDGVKAEKHTPGRQNDAILLEHMNGSPVVILGVGATNTSHEIADAIVRVTGSAAKLYYMGFSHDRGYQYSINDTVAHRQLQDSAAGFYDADTFSTREVSPHGQVSSTQILKHERVNACDSAGSSSCTSRVIWKAPFLDTSYTVTCSLELPGNESRNLTISAKTPESVVVAIQGASISGFVDMVNCIAIHD